MDNNDQFNSDNRFYRGRQVWSGLFLLLVGAIVLMNQLHFTFFPYWLFSWPMILIAIGLFIGIRHRFTGAGWLIMMVLGGLFLADDLAPDFNFNRFIAPAIIISIGLAMIFRPKNSRACMGRGQWARSWDPSKKNSMNEQTAGFSTEANESNTANTGFSQEQNKAGSSDDYIDSVAVFGGTQRVIVSKSFKGGEATSVLGGTELDMSQADIQGTVVLEMTQVLGGAKLIVPSHWYIKNESNAVFGGVADKRQVRGITPDPNRTLVIKGISILGGLEIRNY